MANSYIEYTSGLTATTYSVPFNVLSITDVNVKGYNGTTWSDLTVSSRDAVAKTITLSGAPSAFQKIRVWRNTGTTQLVDFQNGSRLSESDLDTAYQQGLFVAQEVSENASTGALSLGETGAQGATGAAGADGADGISTAPFNPVAVTGATPSLDVGSYNFFDQGTLTANTTLSFASVPTNANWRYSYVAGAASGYSFANVTKATEEFLVTNSTNGAPTLVDSAGLYMKPDGLRFWIVCNTTDAVHAFTMTTAWDVTTASADGVSFDISAKEPVPFSLTFNPDGTMFFVGGNGDALHRYTMSTAWDVSTATYHSTYATAAKGVLDITFRPDGLQCWLLLNDNKVWAATLSTAWDLSTLTITGSSNNFVAQGTPHSFLWNTDGTKCFWTASASTNAYSYSASTAYDVAASNLTLLNTGVLKDGDGVTGGAITIKGMAFSNDGKYLYVVGDGADTVYQFNTPVAATLTLPAAVTNTPNLVPTGSQTATYEFYTLDGGTTVKLIGEEIV